MDDIRLKYLAPVSTGAIGRTPQQTSNIPVQGEGSFKEILNNQLKSEGGVEFSKHAVKRAAEHNIELNKDSIDRLNRGVQLAGEKNLEDTLILVGSAAFVVNIRNNTVITAVNSSKMQGNVFTNINGAVIV